MTSKAFIRKFDWLLFGSAMAVIFFSFLTFYGLDARSEQFIYRHLISVAVAIGVMFVVSFFDYRVFKNYSSASLIVYVIALALLGLALASGEIRGISAWIVFGQFTFQPVEFAKLAVLILLAKYFSQKHTHVNSGGHILGSAIYAGLPLVMVLLQPDFGSALVFVAVWLAILVFSGINRRHIIAIAIVGVVALAVAWFLVLEDYQKNRILSFSDPQNDPQGQGYHLIQSKTAIGSGGLFGTAFNSGKAYTILVPEAYTDFVFTSFAHKFGFVGVVILIGCLSCFMVRLVNIASHQAQNNFSRFFVIGFLGILLIHITVNIGMNLGLLPITGIPLPFLSYGGSHLIMMMAGLGVVESIKLHS